MWFRVEATHRVGGHRRHVDMNVHNEQEALRMGRVWFPVSEWTDHSAEPNAARAEKVAREVTRAL